MINKKSWKEFRESGLLWQTNTILHTFGWSIVCEFDDKGSMLSVYPARVKFRGFDEESNTEGYIRVSKFMKENANELYEESIK